MLFNTSLPVAVAGPEGPQVVNGQVSFQQTGSNTLITASDQAIINYSRFDIARPEVVQFIQPGASASVLNRILSANPTRIDGTLLANGRVFFVNPAGVLIGSEATVNVNQLVASGLNMSNEAFLSGRYEFAGGNGAVINNGDISAQSVWLVGKQVTNAGNIQCPSGYVVMAAGDRVFLSQAGSDVVVEIGSLEPPDQTDPVVPGVGAEVTNEGTIEATGGQVILAVAGDAFSQPIVANMGTLSASTVEGDAGSISIQAPGGQIDNTGSITAASRSGSGGAVTAAGAEVVNSGTIDVSGTHGGAVALNGSINVGQFGAVNADGTETDGGSVNLTAASLVAFGSDSLTTANAGANGSGGEIIAYSPESAVFLPGAQVQAKGGSESGDGGFFELSGHEYVDIFGRVDLTAANGQTGTFLIDPVNVRIQDGYPPQGVASGWGSWDEFISEWKMGANQKLLISILEYFLLGSDVVLTTQSPKNMEGNVTFEAGRDLWCERTWDQTWRDFFDDQSLPLAGETPTTTHNSFTVVADGDITFEPGSGIDFARSGADYLSGFVGTGDVTIQAVGDISIDADIATGGATAIDGASIEVGADLVAGQNLTLYAPVTADAAGPLQVFDAGDGTLAALADIEKTTPGELRLSGDQLNLDGHVRGADPAGSSITLDGDVTAAGAGDQQFGATGTLNVMGNIEKSTVGTLSLGSGSGPLYIGHNVTGTNPAGTNIELFGYVVANGTGDNSEQQFYATGNLTTYDDIEKATAGTLSLGADGGVLHLGHDVKGTHADGSTITFNGNVIADGAGDQQFSATGTLNVTGDIEKATAGTLTLDSGVGALYLAHDILGTHPDGSGILFNDDVIANGVGDQQFDATGTLTAQAINKNTTGSLTLGGRALIDLEGSVNVQNGDLYLQDNTVAASGVKLSAGQDMTLASGKTLTGEGALTVEANRDITFGGDVLAQDLVLTADKDNSAGIDGGTMHAAGTLTTTAGNIVISASDDTIILDDHVYADVADDGDILLNANTLLADGVELWAGHDIVLADGKSMTGAGELTLIADYDGDFDGTIWLGGDVIANAIVFGDSAIIRNNSVIANSTSLSTQTFDGGTGALMAYGTITKTAGTDLTLKGTLVDLDGAVDVQTGLLTVDGPANIAGDVKGIGITFNDPVTADGGSPQLFDAASGTLWALDTITKTAGTDLTLKGALVDLDGAVDVQTGLLTVDGPADIADDVKGIGITFSNPVTADGGSPQLFDAASGTLLAGDTITKTAGTNLTLKGALVDLDGAVDVRTGLLTVDGPANIADDAKGIGITFNDAVTADGGSPQLFDAASGTLLAGDTITKTAGTDLTLKGALVDLDGAVDVQTGLLTVDGPANIADDVKGIDITFNDAVTANGGSPQLFDATSGTLLAGDTITKTGGTDLTLKGALVDLDGAVDVQTGLLTVDGPADIADDVKGIGITFNNPVTADGGSPQLFDAASGTLWALDTITKTAGTDLTLKGASVDLDGAVDVQAGLLTVEGPADIAGDVKGIGITFNDAVTADGGSPQLFDAASGTLLAGDTITKTAGTDLTLRGVAIDLDGAVDVQTGLLTVDGPASIGDDVEGIGITFNNPVAADGGSPQLFDATSGTLWALDTITKTGGTDLTLKGASVDLDGAVDVQTGLLTVDGPANIADDVKGTGITFNNPVTADGGNPQLFDATSGTLLAGDTITKTAGTYLTLKGASVDLDGAVDVQTGLLTVDGLANIDDDVKGIGITFNDAVTADGGSPQLFDAASGTLLASDTVTKTAGTDLTLKGALVNLDGAVDVQTGLLTVGGPADIADDVKGIGITFSNPVTADGGSPQLFDAASGTLWALDTITKTAGTNLTLRGAAIDLDGAVDVQTGLLTIDGPAYIADDVKGIGITFNNPVTADGGSPQSFDGGTGALTANGTITKTAGTNLTLKGAAVDLNRAVDVQTGRLTVQGPADIADDVKAVGVTFNTAVTADGGSPQVFDATSGTLWARSKITKTQGTDLTLKGSSVNLDGSVDVQTGGLEAVGPVDAEGLLQAAGPVHLEGLANLARNVTGDGITFDKAVTADGTRDQLFDAASGTLWAGKKITKTGSGDLTLAGDAAIDLDGTVDVRTAGGSLYILDDFTAKGSLLATRDVILAGSIVNAILDGSKNQQIHAEGGTLTASGTIAKTGAGDLTLRGGSSGLAVDLSDTVTVSSGNLNILADTGDIQVGGNLTSGAGGVSLTAEGGRIYTDDGSGMLNVAISGSSNDNIDGTGSTGVPLRNAGTAAIVICSADTLKLGTAADLSADGKYDAGKVDDRSATYFMSSGQYGGDPIDIAIYLASADADVSLNAKDVYVAPEGTMVVDAYDTVTFGSEFENALNSGGVAWLETCSRITRSLTEAHASGSIPYADEPEIVESWINGPYILRGDSMVEAIVLQDQPVTIRRPLLESEASSTVAPASPELGEIGHIEGAEFANLQWLAEELGLCEGDQRGEDESRCQELTQAYLAGAFLQSTDLRPHRAASHLRTLADLLHDADGSRIAALVQVVSEFVPAPVPPSDEQMTSIASALEIHVNDGTHYDVAGQWLEALTEYTDILNAEIGWSTDESVAFVMGKYCTPITEAGHVGVTAFIQMHLERIGG
jgi:filamentous hemagglutinin family protein